MLEGFAFIGPPCKVVRKTC